MAQEALPVGAAPVELVAVGAAGEALAAAEDEGRHAALDLLARHLDDGAVAVGAAAEEALAVDLDSEVADHLPQLLLRPLRVDEQRSDAAPLSPPRQLGVAGQQDAAALAAAPQQLVVVDGPLVERVEPDGAQPAGQPAEHAVGEELTAHLPDVVFHLS